MKEQHIKWFIGQTRNENSIGFYGISCAMSPGLKNNVKFIPPASVFDTSCIIYVIKSVSGMNKIEKLVGTNGFNFLVHVLWSQCYNNVFPSQSP